MRFALIAAACAVVVGISIAVGLGLLDLGTTMLVLVLLVIVLPISHGMASELDPWLWWVTSLAFLAKLVGAAVRYFVLVGAYEGVGDAAGYHSWGVDLAQVWRSGIVPGLDGSMGEGTQVLRWIAGLIYTPYTPTILGGFFLFATFAFFGQLLFYAAFRRALPRARLGVYALFIFFLPAMVFWPSSIGKESMMIFFLGLATYGLARAFASFSLRWLLLAGGGLLGAGMIRPHMAVLLTVSFALATLLGRMSWDARTTFRRLAVLGIGVVLVVVSVDSFTERFQVTSAEDIDPFVQELERRTQQGGSAVEGDAVFSVADLPGGALRVLFRPLPYEAHNLQSLASALENTALLAFVLWKTPAMVRRVRNIRIPFVLMSAAYTAGFVIAFSTIFNLGILARQRSQTIPYLLAVVVALGWDHLPDRDPNRGRHLELAA